MGSYQPLPLKLPFLSYYGYLREASCPFFSIDWEERYQIAAGSLILPLGTMSSFRCTSSHSVVSDSDLCGSPFARLWTVWVEGPIVGRTTRADDNRQ